jgi:Rps23 Pro-64 3,4-dihydroxylase Tpa1-like proline 4-hydroxylase
LNYLSLSQVCHFRRNALENDFETLIAGYLENRIGISEHFLSEDLAEHLKQNLQVLYKNRLLLAAGTGNNKKLNHDAEVRNDSIYWLDRKHKNSYENDFLDRVEDFIRYLNKSCYAGITGYEFHYSLYEAGSFYTKHLDQFKDNSRRQYSMITYLNAGWSECDGGHLLVQQANGGQKISPTQGKTVFFKSNELVHEVLVTHTQRMSVTGWLKRDG